MYNGKILFCTVYTLVPICFLSGTHLAPPQPLSGLCSHLGPHLSPIWPPIQPLLPSGPSSCSTPSPPIYPFIWLPSSLTLSSRWDGGILDSDVLFQCSFQSHLTWAQYHLTCSPLCENNIFHLTWTNLFQK